MITVQVQNPISLESLIINPTTRWGRSSSHFTVEQNSTN